MESYINYYLSRDVIYSNSKLTSDVLANTEPIMSIDEDEVMMETANILCSNSGSVLNVGFGMGIIDSYIRNLNPKEHHIIEAHPQVCEKAKEMGFDVYCGKWEDVVKTLISDGKKFDSIYFDTFLFNVKKEPQWSAFSRIVPQLLNSGGIYSYFNGIASKYEKVEDILNEYGWERKSKIISTPNNPAFKEGYYDLVWYINK